MLFASEYFRYKIFIHEKCLENENDKFQENLSRPGIIDARVRYRAAARRLRNTSLLHLLSSLVLAHGLLFFCTTHGNSLLISVRLKAGIVHFYRCR